MAKKESFFKTHFNVLKNTGMKFGDEDALKYSASLAYYTVFSLGPILVLMISLAGVFLGQDAIEGRVYSELREFIGSNAAAQVEELIKNLSLSGQSTMALIISAVTLLVSATVVFGDIQNSINKIWRVKPKVKKGWVKMIKDRLLSSSLVIGLGFLLVVTLVINGVVLAFTDVLQQYFHANAVVLFSGLNFLLSFCVIFVLFAVIFKVLPDVNIKWRTVTSGAIFTALLFVIGRYAIGIYIGMSDTESTYGAASSIILILLWVYYTAAILYVGALYTREYAEYMGVPIEPSEFAVHIDIVETEIDEDEHTTESPESLNDDDQKTV